MRAVVVSEFGGPEVMQVQERPDPVAGPGQVVVEVNYSDVGTLDRLLRSGWGEEFFEVRPPYVPGDGVGGTVSAVGDGVDPNRIGRPVVGGTGPRGPNGMTIAPINGYAERAVIDATVLVDVPDGLDQQTAAAVVNDGPTSQLLMDVAEPRAGQTALVMSAAGAGGVLAVQLLAARGVRVIGAARGERKTAFLREVGVEHVVDYGEPDWTARVREIAPRGADIVLDGAGSDLGHAAFALTADGGRFLSYGTSAGELMQTDAEQARRRGVTAKGLTDLAAANPSDRNRLTQRALSAAADGTARPIVTVLPLEAAAQAHRALEGRTAVGKTLLATRT